VKKFLLAVCAVAVLCAACNAQVPGYTPPSTPKYARTELFAGYSYGYTDLFNSGNRANLNGWNGSVALNVANWLGFMFDASGFYGTSRIPAAVPAPFPPCPIFCPPPGNTFNVNTRLYSYLFGAQIPYRKSQTWTPFAEVLFGHSAVRGTVPGIAETSGGLGLVGGLGVDRRINDRFAFRIKADYLQTRTSFPLPLGHAKQDNLRVSVGIVIRSVHRKKPTLEDETQP
jgi:opacity protein-like surface antigen